MSTITWKVNTLSRTLSTGRVDFVHYGVDARSDDGVHSAPTYGELALEGDIATAYAELNEATVVGWVKAALGDDKVAEVNAALEAQLTEQATPTTGTGVPW
jgi:hypothetical protein